VRNYRDELQRLQFEPEKSFETLIPEEDVLITGAIDVVRLDDPPTVTLIDFKSGNSSGDNASGLSAEMMAMQLGVYGIAAKKELEFEPDVGLVRYVGEKDPDRREVRVDMSDARRAEVRANIAGTARQIKARDFKKGPAVHLKGRCGYCDFGRICPAEEARAQRASGTAIHN
jgi:DNA helicase-2/ATP-dependent DNA helicase PcrA